MDSGNSGSMQSSSGGDEEYDSRAFMSSTGNASNILSSSSSLAPTHSHQRQQQQQQQTLSSVAFFDSLPAYNFNTFSRLPPPPSNSNPLLNLDMSWVTARTHTNCTDLPGTIMSSIPPSSSLPLTSSSQTSINPPIPTTQKVVANPSSSDSTTPRGSKKRPRASRRAPTTVLTTDTSNFRQMVQEFTGIPTPPFSSPAFPRARFDLFNAAASIRSSPSAGAGLLRPFAQKVAIPPQPAFNPFAPSSTCASTSTAIAGTAISVPTTSGTSPSIDTMTITTTAITAAPTACSDPNSTSNYQLPSDLRGLNQSQTLMQNNPMFTFQSLLQSSTPSQNFNLQAMFGSKVPQVTPTMSPGDHASSTHGIPSLFASEGMASASRGGGSSGGDGGGDLLGWGDGSGVGGGQQHYRSTQQLPGCKTSDTANSMMSTSEFHAEKGPDNVCSRGEGMLDSWICSSD